MSKRESFTRYNLLIKLLKRKPSTFKQISDYLDRESELHSQNFSISKRTFQRDLLDIRTIYNIDIQYDYNKKVYSIDYDQSPEFNERLFEAFDTFNALNIAENLSGYVHLEKRKPQGTENLYGLLHAIRNSIQIRFVYTKFWDEKASVRTVNPFALKEFRNRWYLMGLDHEDKQIKSFALDRLSDLDITRIKFAPPQDFDMHAHFKYCFGIVSPNSSKPTEIVLSFTPLQGKYIKTLPLHETQEVIVDNKTEVRIRIKVFITHDLIMEILSFGDSVKVIDPPEMVEEIVSTYKSALGQYE